jgi:predicted small secreted protein
MVVIAIVAVIGFILAACGTTSGGKKGGKSGASKGVAKTLVITEIGSYSGDILVTVSSTATPAASMVAVGGAAVSGGSVTLPLVIPKKEDTRWTGTGDYFIVLVFENDNNAVYFYSAGGMSALRYSFSNATTTIPLSQFRRR